MESYKKKYSEDVLIFGKLNFIPWLSEIMAVIKKGMLEPFHDVLFAFVTPSETLKSRNAIPRVCT